MSTKDITVDTTPVVFRGDNIPGNKSTSNNPDYIAVNDSVLNRGEATATSVSDKAKQPADDKPFHVPPVLTQEAVEGIKFDFNNGIRVQTPDNGKRYKVRFTDSEAGIVLYDDVVNPNSIVSSVKKFFIQFHMEIYTEDGKTKLFSHNFNAKGMDVLVQLPRGAIGDTIAWFSYVERFKKKHKCNLYVTMDQRLRPLFEPQYPDIHFIEYTQIQELTPYATYYLGLFFKGDVDNQPVDFRYIGLHKSIGCILDVPLKEEPPRLDLSATRKIAEPYVCIGAQASSKAKDWNNPYGWMDVIAFLKSKGYRVLCLDKDRVTGDGQIWNTIPFGCEDFTGDIPLQERVNLIKDADFFIGLSSGLSWIAWCCRVPVVLISGFTHPMNEFETPYRVINYHVCNSCWNDMRCEFDHRDFLWCPRHAKDSRRFECTKLISAEQVIKTIKKIPAFQAHAKKFKEQN